MGAAACPEGQPFQALFLCLHPLITSKLQTENHPSRHSSLHQLKHRGELLDGGRGSQSTHPSTPHTCSKTGSEGRRKGTTRPPGGGTPLGATRSTASTLRFHGLRDPSPSSPAHPRGRARVKRRFLPLPCPSVPRNPLTDMHRAPSHRFPPTSPPSPLAGDRPSFALRPPPRVRVRACPWGSPLSPLRKAAGPHLHPRQARLHGGVSHGGGRDAVRREPGLLRRFQGTGLSSCPHSPAHGIFLLLLLALPPSEAAPVRRRRERGRPKLGLFRPPSRMQRRRPPPPLHHPASSPGRACEAAVTGALARSRQRDDKPEGRRQGRRRQRRCARPASPTRLPAHAASPGPRSHTHTYPRHHR